MAQAANGTDSQAMADPTQRRYRGSAKITDYETMKEKLGEGTFGVVSKARSKRTGKVVALKKIIIHSEKDGFPITALREIKLLKMLSHPNILRLEEMAVERHPVDKNGKDGIKRATLYMVTPYMEHDLSGMLTNPDIRFSDAQIKCYLLQLLEGVRYLHDSHILHRDMKAANILISNNGLLQIADFGLARHYDGVPPQAGRGNGVAERDYTSLVVTRWYRPPELLLTLKKYTPAIDIWGVGCVFGEMFERKPILEGKTDVDQCVRIFQLVGSPNDSNMPGWSDLPGCEGTTEWDPKEGDIDKRFGPKMGPQGIDLMKKLLCLDWRKRINAIDALQHKYFNTEPLPARPEQLPQYEDSHELDARRRGEQKHRALPAAPAGGTVGMGPDEWTGSGPPMNGYGFGDRGPRNFRDRGPQRGYDDRRGPPLADTRPQWKQDRDRERARGLPPPPTNGHPLPQRPEIPARGPPPAGNRGGDRGGPNVDTYIPSYSAVSANDRPRPAYRDHDGPAPRDRDRPAYHDPDPPPRRSRSPYGYRDRDYERQRPYGRDDQRRTRSRSPDREWRARDKDGDGRRDRDRPQNRERDVYRR